MVEMLQKKVAQFWVAWAAYLSIKIEIKMIK
jgi:hypothetical protein